MKVKRKSKTYDASKVGLSKTSFLTLSLSAGVIFRWNELALPTRLSGIGVESTSFLEEVIEFSLSNDGAEETLPPRPPPEDECNDAVSASVGVGVADDEDAAEASLSTACCSPDDRGRRRLPLTTRSGSSDS